MKKYFSLLLLLISLSSFAQTIDGALKTVTASGTNTYTITESFPAAYTNKERFIVEFTNGNSGAATLNRNGLGAKAIVTADGSALVGGELAPLGRYILSYNGTHYRIVGSTGGGAGLVDGDYGDITVGSSGTTMTIDAGAVTGSKIASSIALAGSPTTTTQSQADGSTKIATTLYVDTGLAGKQAVDSDLTTIAGLTPTTDNIIQSVGSAWASRTPSQVKTALVLNNLDNTSDANKPVSTATQTALDLKAEKFPVINTYTASHTLDFGTDDQGETIEMNVVADNEVTIAAFADEAYPLYTAFTITSINGNTTIVNAPTVTFINPSGSLLIDDPGGIAYVFKRATNEWYVWTGSPSSITPPSLGGTGVDNGSKTITLGGNLTTTGAFNTTLAMLGANTITFPNASITVARIDAAQTFTGTQTFTSAPNLTGSSTTGFVWTATDNAGNGGWAVSGTANWGLSTASTQTFTQPLTFSGTTTNILKFKYDNLGITQTRGAGIWLENAQAAINGTQQRTPSVALSGKVFETTGSTSQDYYWTMDGLGVQGTSATRTSNLLFNTSINGGAAATAMTLSAAGTVTITGVSTTTLATNTFSVNSTNGGTSPVVSVTGTGRSATSGTVEIFTNNIGIAPTSGTATFFVGPKYTGTLNQTGGANGDIIFSDFAATVTAANGNVYGYLSRPSVSKSGFATGTPNSTLHTAGSFATGYVAKTGAYTLTSTDYTVEVTSGTHNQTLPTAVGITGRVYVITNSGSGTVTVDTTSSQTFANVTATPTTLTLIQFQTAIVQSNGANWLKIGGL